MKKNENEIPLNLNAFKNLEIIHEILKKKSSFKSKRRTTSTLPLITLNHTSIFIFGKENMPNQRRLLKNNFVQVRHDSQKRERTNSKPPIGPNRSKIICNYLPHIQVVSNLNAYELFHYFQNPDGNYTKIRNVIPLEISDWRKKTVKFIFEKISKNKCSINTVFLSFQALDKALRNINIQTQTEEELRIMTVSSMMLASKLEDYFPIMNHIGYNMISNFKYTPEDLRDKEREVFNKIGFTFEETIYESLNLQILSIKNKLKNKMQLSTLALLNEVTSLAQKYAKLILYYNQFSYENPSMIALVCLKNAIYTKSLNIKCLELAELKNWGGLVIGLTHINPEILNQYSERIFEIDREMGNSYEFMHVNNIVFDT